jgi:hypothetical protein
VINRAGEAGISRLSRVEIPHMLGFFDPAKSGNGLR